MLLLRNSCESFAWDSLKETKILNTGCGSGVGVRKSLSETQVYVTLLYKSSGSGGAGMRAAELCMRFVGPTCVFFAMRVATCCVALACAHSLILDDVSRSRDHRTTPVTHVTTRFACSVHRGSSKVSTRSKVNLGLTRDERARLTGSPHPYEDAWIKIPRYTSHARQRTQVRAAPLRRYVLSNTRPRSRRRMGWWLDVLPMPRSARAYRAAWALPDALPRRYWFRTRRCAR